MAQRLRTLRRAGVTVALVVGLILLTSACGGGSGTSRSGSSKATVAAKARPNAALKKKLETCATLYNRQETARMMQNPTEPEVLITTDREGNCVVAFDPYTGGGDGSLGAVAVVRSPQGEWGLYISSELASIEDLHSETERWEAEREEAPNAEIVAGPSIIEFVPSASLPRGAVLAPPLVTKPVASECSLTVSFSGGEVGAFTASLEESVGVSCSQAQRVVSKILTEPGYEGFECSSEGGEITESVYRCSKGFDEFRFTTSPAGRPSAGRRESGEAATATDSEGGEGEAPRHPLTPSEVTFCHRVVLTGSEEEVPVFMSTVGVSCENALEVVDQTLFGQGTPPPEGFECSGLTSEAGRCLKGDEEIVYSKLGGKTSMPLRAPETQVDGKDRGTPTEGAESPVPPSTEEAAIITAPGKGPTVEPRELRISLGSYPLVVKRLHWTSWGGEAATGTGILEMVNCEAACASGTYEPRGPATVRLGGADEVCGEALYRVIVLKATQMPDFGGAFRLSCSGVAEADGD